MAWWLRSGEAGQRTPNFNNLQVMGGKHDAASRRTAPLICSVTGTGPEAAWERNASACSAPTCEQRRGHGPTGPPPWGTTERAWEVPPSHCICSSSLGGLKAPNPEFWGWHSSSGWKKSSVWGEEKSLSSLVVPCRPLNKPLGVYKIVFKKRKIPFSVLRLFAGAWGVSLYFTEKNNIPNFRRARIHSICSRRYWICQDPFRSRLQKYHKTSNLPLQPVNLTDPKLRLHLTLF